MSGGSPRTEADVAALTARARTYAEKAVETIEIWDAQEQGVSVRDMEAITQAIAMAWAVGWAAGNEDGERPARRRSVRR